MARIRYLLVFPRAWTSLSNAMGALTVNLKFHYISWYFYDFSRHFQKDRKTYFLLHIIHKKLPTFSLFEDEKQDLLNFRKGDCSAIYCWNEVLEIVFWAAFNFTEVSPNITDRNGKVCCQFRYSKNRIWKLIQRFY